MKQRPVSSLLLDLKDAAFQIQYLVLGPPAPEPVDPFSGRPLVTIPHFPTLGHTLLVALIDNMITTQSKWIKKGHIYAFDVVEKVILDSHGLTSDSVDMGNPEDSESFYALVEHVIEIARETLEIVAAFLGKDRWIMHGVYVGNNPMLLTIEKYNDYRIWYYHKNIHVK